MTNTRRIDYSNNKEISAIAIDASHNMLWIAYKINSSGYSILKRVSAFDPTQTYYSINIEVDEIKKLIINGSDIYCLYNDSSYIGSRYSLTNPLTIYTNFNLPGSVVEVPVDFTVDGNYVYYLIPGEMSGQHASIVKLDTTGSYIETIDLSTVTDAKAICFDENSEIRVVTYTDPVKLIRVWDDGGWNYSITSIGA